LILAVGLKISVPVLACNEGENSVQQLLSRLLADSPTA
jgi:hypothetical protein